MKLWGALYLSSWVVPPPPPPPMETTPLTTSVAVNLPASTTMRTTLLPQGLSSAALQQGISSFVVAAETAAPPSKADVQLLRQAFAEFYGVDRDLKKSQELLSTAIDLWANQAPDERAALYRVRGDCYTLLADADKAAADYEMAIQLLSTPAAQAAADPSELPAALLGRARAIVGGSGSTTTTLSPTAAKQAAADYEQYLKLSSREEWDTDAELIQDGASRNPFAAWEWGLALRRAGQYAQAQQAHALAAQAFAEIGDKARSVISLLDAGIDAAAANNVQDANAILTKAIPQTKGVESRDVALLQRVIAKEGEGRMALAALLWNDATVKDGKAQAEKLLGDACVRLEQMQATNSKSPKGVVSTSATPSTGLRFSIDDSLPAALDVSCYKFKNPAFLEQLEWPEELQRKVIKLETLR